MSAGTSTTYPTWGGRPDTVEIDTAGIEAVDTEVVDMIAQLGPAANLGQGGDVRVVSEPGTDLAQRDSGPKSWRADTGATTAEYAITTLAACGFGGILVILLKSEPVRKLIWGVIQAALGIGS